MIQLLPEPSRCADIWGRQLIAQQLPSRQVHTPLHSNNANRTSNFSVADLTDCIMYTQATRGARAAQPAHDRTRVRRLHTTLQVPRTGSASVAVCGAFLCCCTLCCAVFLAKEAEEVQVHIRSLT